MNEKTNSCHEVSSIDTAREALKVQHVTSFLESLHDSDNPANERNELHRLVQASLKTSAFDRAEKLSDIL